MGDEKEFTIQEHFTSGGKVPRDYFEWRRRDAPIIGRDGKVIYEGKNLETPKTWSDTATRVVGSKYFFKGDGSDYIEDSLPQLVHRVAKTVSDQTVRQGILSKPAAERFYKELSYLAFNQGWAANSPVWFNVGLHDEYGVSESEVTHSHWIYDGKGGFTSDVDAYEHPQAAACFIQSIQDNMDSIMNHAKKEAMLFKFGSGTGTNYGNLRAVNEPLSGGGYASGQTSFMKIYDIVAGSVQSGGKTRRAAKMVIQPCDHPDVFRFINWKVEEEKKALWLSANHLWGPRKAGDLESEAYKTVTGQNGNNSVRVTDKFMEAALRGEEWDLWFRTADRINQEVDISLDQYVDDPYLSDKRFIKRLTNKRKVVNAGDVLEQLARAAAVTGDPAIQYDDNINRWNTIPNSGRINASNPCSEFMAPDDSACNLASINLTKYSVKRPGTDGSNTDDHSPAKAERVIGHKIVGLDSLEQAVKLSIIAQETLVDYASYPSKEIAENSHKFRPLGLGYTNLGALLMENGLAYDSKEGRALASAVTSLMTAYAYRTSAELASQLGAFEDFEKNREPMLNVIGMHRDATKQINRFKGMTGLEEILDEAERVWENVLELGAAQGFRNSQVTLLAPTGTIGLMMDVDCTGIEPMTAISYGKGLAGGGEIQMEVKPCVERGLKTLGYRDGKLEDIMKYIKEKNSVVGAPGLSEKDYDVFATAFGDNTISVDGHLQMMGAVQPFLSGAISKTVNLPKGSTIKDVKRAYVSGWELSLKSVSLYIDGSKGVQPLNLKTNGAEVEPRWGERVKPKNSLFPGGFIERPGWNVSINGTGVHLMVGEYDNRPPKDSPADFFVEFGSAGSPHSATYGSWGKEASRNRQRGMKLQEFIKHNKGASGTIQGWTDHPFIKKCSSIEDMFAKLIQLEYLGDTSVCSDQNNLPNKRQMKELRCNVLGNRRRVRHYQSRIDFIEAAMEDGELIPIFPLYEDELETGEISSMDIFCTECGHKTELSGANCRKCNNCGDASECG